MIEANGTKVKISGNAGDIMVEICHSAQSFSEKLPRTATLVFIGAVLDSLEISDNELNEIQRMRREMEEKVKLRMEGEQDE